MHEGQIGVLCTITTNFGEFEILSKLFFIDSEPRGGERRVMGERRGRVKSRNMCKGPMDKDNRGED